MIWHYTCRHRSAKIGQRGILAPYPQPLFDGLPLVWLTDLDVPDVEALGLTSVMLKCDRTEVRYRVRGAADIVPWSEFLERTRLDPLAVSEITFGRQPQHWLVSTSPVPVRLS